MPAPSAPRGNGLSLVSVDDLPAACRELGRLADSPSENQALSARISLASCMVGQQVPSIPVCDCEQSVRDLDALSVQSLALLDEVVQVGDAAMQILALQARAELLSSFSTRVLASVPPAKDASESAIALRTTRLALITPVLAPWQQGAREAYARLERIARVHPELANNAAVVAAVRHSRQRLARPTATATR